MSATWNLPGSRRDTPHGTRARYVAGCRCDNCRAANNRAYHERRARALEAASEIGANAGRAGSSCPGIEDSPCPHGTRLRRDSGPVCARCIDRLAWNGLVDAAPARRHIRALSRQGIGRRAVAAASDVGETTLEKIRTGRKRRIRKRTSEAILAVDLAAASDHAKIPAGPTWRMLRELEPEFLTRGRLARALGYRTPALQIGRKLVLARTELRVRRLYELTFPGRASA